MAAGAQGVLFSLTTGFCWALAPLFWSGATRRIGSMNVNLMRMLMAVVVLAVVLVPYSLAAGASLRLGGATVAWLMVSGIVHLAIGDAFYYEAIRRLGPRRAVQLLTLFPVWAVLVGWFWLGERLSLQALAGAALVMGSISYLAYAEGKATHTESREPGKMSAAGFLFGVLASMGIGLGAVLSRRAFCEQPGTDPIMATTVRMAAACAALWLVPIARGRANQSLRSLNDRHVMWRMICGTIAGPLVGMATYVAAMKFAEAGLVATLSATSPLFILPIVAVRYRVRIGPTIILASIAAVVGVGLISWTSRGSG